MATATFSLYFGVAYEALPAILLNPYYGLLGEVTLGELILRIIPLLFKAGAVPSWTAIVDLALSPAVMLDMIRGQGFDVGTARPAILAMVGYLASMNSDYWKDQTRKNVEEFYFIALPAICEAVTGKRPEICDADPSWTNDSITCKISDGIFRLQTAPSAALLTELTTRRHHHNTGDLQDAGEPSTVQGIEAKEPSEAKETIEVKEPGKKKKRKRKGKDKQPGGEVKAADDVASLEAAQKEDKLTGGDPDGQNLNAVAATMDDSLIPRPGTSTSPPAAIFGYPPVGTWEGRGASDVGMATAALEGDPSTSAPLGQDADVLTAVHAQTTEALRQHLNLDRTCSVEPAAAEEHERGRPMTASSDGGPLVGLRGTMRKINRVLADLETPNPIEGWRKEYYRLNLPNAMSDADRKSIPRDTKALCRKLEGYVRDVNAHFPLEMPEEEEEDEIGSQYAGGGNEAEEQSGGLRERVGKGDDMVEE